MKKALLRDFLRCDLNSVIFTLIFQNLYSAGLYSAKKVREDMNWIRKTLMNPLKATIFGICVATLFALIGTPFFSPAGTTIGGLIGLFVFGWFADKVTAKCCKFRREARAAQAENKTIDETHTDTCPCCNDWINRD